MQTSLFLTCACFQHYLTAINRWEHSGQLELSELVLEYKFTKYMLYSGVDKPTVKRQSHQFCVLLLCLRNIELSCELSSAAEICDTVCDV